MIIGASGRTLYVACYNPADLTHEMDRWQLQDKITIKPIIAWVIDPDDDDVAPVPITPVGVIKWPWMCYVDVHRKEAEAAAYSSADNWLNHWLKMNGADHDQQR